MLTPHPCPTCGLRFIGGIFGYCSVFCLQHEAPARECGHCRKVFLPMSRDRQFCSVKCMGKARTSPVQYKQCEYCAKRYAAAHQRARYCSQACMGKANSLPTQYKQCESCGRRYAPINKTGKRFARSRYCSKPCAGIAVRQRWLHRSAA